MEEVHSQPGAENLDKARSGVISVSPKPSEEAKSRCLSTAARRSRFLISLDCNDLSTLPADLLHWFFVAMKEKNRHEKMLEKKFYFVFPLYTIYLQMHAALDTNINLWSCVGATSAPAMYPRAELDSLTDWQGKTGDARSLSCPAPTRAGHEHIRPLAAEVTTRAVRDDSDRALKRSISWLEAHASWDVHAVNRRVPAIATCVPTGVPLGIPVGIPISAVHTPFHRPKAVEPHAPLRQSYFRAQKAPRVAPYVNDQPALSPAVRALPFSMLKINDWHVSGSGAGHAHGEPTQLHAWSPGFTSTASGEVVCIGRHARSADCYRLGSRCNGACFAAAAY
jgi:hypothetical protein